MPRGNPPLTGGKGEQYNNSKACKHRLGDVVGAASTNKHGGGKEGCGEQQSNNGMHCGMGALIHGQSRAKKEGGHQREKTKKHRQLWGIRGEKTAVEGVAVAASGQRSGGREETPPAVCSKLCIKRAVRNSSCKRTAAESSFTRANDGYMGFLKNEKGEDRRRIAIRG